MMYDSYHTIVNFQNQRLSKVDTIVDTFGNRQFGTDRKLQRSEGDILEIKNAGAYGFSMASNYNSRLRPAEVLVINKEAKLIRERETMEDLLKLQIEVDV